MRLTRTFLLLAAQAFVLLATLPLSGADMQPTSDEGITWLVSYDDKALPTAPWVPLGTPVGNLEEGSLRLVDDGSSSGSYRATWSAESNCEIVVEARVKVISMTGAVRNKPSTSLWPWRDGAPVMVQVSDGRHQEGLVLYPNQATTFTDRFIPLGTTQKFHTYRLVIRGTNMQIFVDGVQRVQGQGAFWHPATSPEPFIEFGSHAKTATGDALWEYVKLGVRQPTTAQAPDPLNITISEPWPITERPGVRETRPYLYDLGQGLLLMSVAQGPDAFYEPYGLLKSSDAGKTWTPIPGLDQLDTTPLPCLRRPDGTILAMSRWTRLQPDGSVSGKTVHLNSDATRFTMHDNRILLPKEYANATDRDQTVCERHLWNDADGGVTMVLWSRKNVPLPDGRNSVQRFSHLVRSTDEGATWNYYATIGPGGEPAVVRLGGNNMTAVIRGDRDSRMRQVFSHDAGRTWSPPQVLEEGRVLPDLVLMSNGVLACSYGRPASCLMFSLDGGQTWPVHRVISDKVGFNYTSIREISPGRLLYVHDAPKLQALYIDVERLGQDSNAP